MAGGDELEHLKLSIEESRDFDDLRYSPSREALFRSVDYAASCSKQGQPF